VVEVGTRIQDLRTHGGRSEPQDWLHHFSDRRVDPAAACLRDPTERTRAW